MRRLWPLVVLAVVGCGPAGEPVAESASPQPQATVSPSAPDLVSGTLALTKDDDKVQVGSKAEDALGVFPKPSAQALSVNTLPKGFPAETYAVDGWESVDGADGFGVITTPVNSIKRVAVAIQRSRVDTREAADGIVADYTKQFGPPTATKVSGDLTYTLWEDGKNRMMILEAPAKSGKCQMTLALGVASLLSPLRIDVRFVEADIDALSKEAPEKTEPSGP